MPVCDALVKNAHIINGSGTQLWGGDVAVLQGATTVIAGNCDISVAPSRYNPEYSSFTAKRRSAA